MILRLFLNKLIIFLLIDYLNQNLILLNILLIKINLYYLLNLKYN